MQQIVSADPAEAIDEVRAERPQLAVHIAPTRVAKKIETSDRCVSPADQPMTTLKLSLPMISDLFIIFNHIVRIVS